MSANREFVINFGTLSSGEYEFNFEIKDSFFQRFEQSVIQNGNVDVLVVVEKKEGMILLDFTMEGAVTTTCDRCLENLDLDINTYNELIAKIGEVNEELSENVIMISSKDYEIDVAQFIYEFITLVIPMRNVHDEEETGNGCDPEVLKMIEKHKTPDEAPSDPRWDGLKNINLN